MPISKPVLIGGLVGLSVLALLATSGSSSASAGELPPPPPPPPPPGGTPVSYEFPDTGAPYPPYDPAQNQPAAPGAPSSMTNAPGSGAPIDSIAGQQEALNLAGASPPLKVDGVLGQQMRAATIAFQTAHGLTPDGIIGPATKNTLLDVITAY